MKIKIKDAGRHLAVTTGYGQMSAQIGRHLNALGHDVYYDFIAEPNDKDLAEIVRKQFKHTPDTIYLWIRPPHYVKNKDFNENHLNIFYTMHESEKFEGWKEDWPKLLNKCRAVIFPTQWNKKIFSNAGVKVPIYVLPLGVDPKIFCGSKTGEFSILSVHEALGKDGSREKWKDSVSAYMEVFKDVSHEVSFTIKSWNTDTVGFYKHVGDVAREIGRNFIDLPKFNLIEAELLPQDMNILYAKHWVFLKNASKDDWGLPVHEAMTAGVDILCSDLPPMREFLCEKQTRWFGCGDIKKLKEELWRYYKLWRKWKSYVNSFSWKVNVKKLEKILGEVGK